MQQQRQQQQQQTNKQTNKQTYKQKERKKRWHQGDQIGRIFAHWAIVNLKHLFENFKIILILGHFFHGKNYYVNLGKEIDWATIWAIFSQTHLVTLDGTDLALT
jgi:hypothetical protein